MKDRVTLVATMRVTEPQALALQAMFNQWNRLASWGSSRFVGFYVDGDGDFKPNVTCAIHGDIKRLDEELESVALVNRVEGDDRNQSEYKYDFDPIAWTLRHRREEIEKMFREPSQSGGEEQMAPSAIGNESDKPAESR